MHWTVYKKGFKAFLQLEKSLSDHSVEAYLRDIDKFKKLFSLVCVAFTICLTIGRVYVSKVQKVKINKINRIFFMLFLSYNIM